MRSDFSWLTWDFIKVHSFHLFIYLLIETYHKILQKQISSEKNTSKQKSNLYKINILLNKEVFLLYYWYREMGFCSGEVQLSVMFTVFRTDVSGPSLFFVFSSVWSGRVLIIITAMHQDRIFHGRWFIHQQSLENPLVWTLLLKVILIHLQLKETERFSILFDIQ